MNLPPKQMKRQVLQRVTATPAVIQNQKPNDPAPTPAETPEPKAITEKPVAIEKPKATAVTAEPKAIKAEIKAIETPEPKAIETPEPKAVIEEPEQPKVMQQPTKAAEPAQKEKEVQPEVLQAENPRPLPFMRKPEAKKKPIERTKPTHSPLHKKKHETAASIPHDKFRPQASPAGAIGKDNKSKNEAVAEPEEAFTAVEKSAPRQPQKASKDPSNALQQRLGMDMQESTDSLPVLRAFQEFLDTERKRSKRQIAILTTCFTIILLLIVTSGILGGLLFMKPLKDEYASMKVTLESYKTEVSDSRDYIQTSLVGISKEMQNDKATLSSTKEELKLLTTSYDKTITDLRGIIETLNSENSSLKSDMNTVKRNIPALNRDLKKALKEIAKMRSNPESEQEIAIPKETLAKNYVTLDVMPTGLKRGVKLRLPIEE